MSSENRFAQSSAVYFNYSLEYAIRDLHALGYSAVEIWGGRPHMYRDDLAGEMSHLRALLAELGMTVCNLIPAQFRYPSLLCAENEAIRTSSVEYIVSAMHNALAIGAPTVSLCPGMALWDGDMAAAEAALKRSFEELDEIAATLGLTLLIEPAHEYETNIILTVEQCLRWIDMLKSDRFGVLIDTGHCHLNGESLSNAVKQCKGLPLHIHIDDNAGDFDSHLIPGAGTIDYQPLAGVLRETGYDGYVSAELGTAYINDPHKACKTSLQTLTEIFGTSAATG